MNEAKDKAEVRIVSSGEKGVLHKGCPWVEESEWCVDHDSSGFNPAYDHYYQHDVAFLYEEELPGNIEVPGSKPESKTSRQEVIDEASKLIHSDRNASYGEPTQNFKDTAALWNTQFGHKLREPLTSTDVAQAMILLKMARMKASPKKDNWADAIGYAACGFECDVTEGRISE